MLRKILLLATLLFLETAFGAESCIVGDPRDQSLIKIFDDETNPDNGPIRLWRASSNGEMTSCEPAAVPVSDSNKYYLPQILQLRQNIRRNWSSYPVISPDCVAAAMRTIDTGVMKVAVSYQANTKDRPSPNCKRVGKKKPTLVCPTDAQICDLDDNIKKIRAGSAPCVTQEMAKYIAWMLSQAVSCLSPDNDSIDGRTLFRKLNNESQFAFFITSRNGTGLHQIVQIMNREMLAPDRGYGEIIAPIAQLLNEKEQNNPLRKKACEPFREVIEKTPPQPLKTKYVFDPCSLTQPGLGVARSVLLGVGNFAHVSYTYKVAGKNVSANSQVISLGFDPLRDPAARELRDLIAMSYYSAAGPRGGLAAFEVSRNNLGCDANSKRCTSKNMLEEFRRQMSNYYKRHRLPDYFNKIDQRYKGLLTRMDGGPAIAPVSYSTAEMRGDRCIE